MPDYTPLALLYNPFNPERFDPSDLIQLSIPPKIGIDGFKAQLESHEDLLKERLNLNDLQKHTAAIFGPSDGGRTSLRKLLVQRVKERLKDLGDKNKEIFCFESEPAMLLGQDVGPNQALQDILTEVIEYMEQDSGNRFAKVKFIEAKDAVLNSKAIADISNAFIKFCGGELKAFTAPLVFIFENLNSAQLYDWLWRTFRTIPSIKFISAYEGSDVETHFKELHAKDPYAWIGTVTCVEYDESIALIQHNLGKARKGHGDGLFPFSPEAINGFFNAAPNQPLGRVMRACLRSLALRAADLQANPAAPPLIDDFNYMKRALERNIW